MIISLNQPQLEKCNMKSIIGFDFLKSVLSNMKYRRYSDWKWVEHTNDVPHFHKGVHLQETEGEILELRNVSWSHLEQKESLISLANKTHSIEMTKLLTGKRALAISLFLLPP